MLKLDAIFGGNKTHTIQEIKAPVSGETKSAEDIILFGDGDCINISSLNLSSADKKNLEIAIALADIEAMSGLKE